MEVGSRRGRDIFSSSTLMVAGPSCSSASTVKSPPEVEHGISLTAAGGAGRHKASEWGNAKILLLLISRKIRCQM
ncbi:UNVERIFIED_CONTAM: hypothetical protein Slati_1519200 [Sesamum latifolium]|uniref:Uncharacterized protein n=1 Tax=Sesamum latifolium TaxID=2727402 RepID=A0AAW2X706_9LAMI